MYEGMWRVRKFEQKAADAFTKGLCAGNIHLCIGQEATVIGATKALEKRDFITSTHRGHGHCIGKGARTDRAMAELFGKATGYCGGKGGSMHIADVSLGILGANGIVGAGIPIATGSALASKTLGTDEVTLCFFGDGASNHGTFHESLNMAAAWDLPVVYLCENNQYAVSVNIHTVTNTDTIAVRAKAYDIPGKTVDGCDVLAVYEAVKEAVARARKGKGPSLIECMTYRHQGHYCGDPAAYRPDSYMAEALKRDGIKRFGGYLLQNGFTPEELQGIEDAMAAEIEAAFEFSQSSPYPDAAMAVTDVYTTDNERSVAR
ncbi:MAG: thiamine pyrophosphate-dependent dehydrogenase E1 component subunit alpha [Deltaproteobacteria bacterium]|nr:thiamine pyrophosphate-dependent dehydrogenase E1 component subunit alpha [Deltaproteobacteria bacterium]